MSETSGVNKRTRRRAIRSEGPPPDEPGTTQVFVAQVPAAATPLVEDAAAEPAAAESTAAVVEDAPPAALDADAVVEDAAAAPTAGESAESEAPAAVSAQATGRWQWAVAAAALVLAVAVGAATVWMGMQRNDLADQAAMRADYVQTAKQAMINITNISADTAQDDIKRVLQVTSGDLATEYTQRKDDYAAIVQKAAVHAKGEVIEAALQSSDDQSAIVLVAVKQVLTNAGSDAPQQRQFRFKVTLARNDKGITATGMEMVV
ncbi:hypothetical protein [Nocardia sp. NBC_01327]|uniref:hypothetical protein n=1 Tax=Nocardia sp. NBC_01327 TaxID=2903593 RepID=UPI002E0E7520|nr:hypothetical protein OG326_05095 [Nocardia sp. NBC_01327]